ncbi:MAG: DNA polymerase sliding clamp [Acidilobaceae archaeon]
MKSLFKMHFKDARTWRYILSSIEKVLDEGVFIASREGLKLRALDPSHVVMVDLFYPASAFIEYEVKKDEIEIGVSFETLTKVLRRGGKEDELAIELEENNLNISFLGRGIRKFSIPTINLLYDKLPEPKVSFTVRAKMLSSVFRDVIKSLEKIGDSIKFKAREDVLIVIGSSDVMKGEVELSLDKQSLIEYEAESLDESSYTLEYFTYMATASQAADIVSIQYANEAPIRVDLEYMGGGRLTFYVSPRVE